MLLLLLLFYLIHLCLFSYLLLLFGCVSQGLGTTKFTNLMAEIESNVNRDGKTADFTYLAIG